MDYTHPVDSTGQDFPWTSQETYIEGEVIVVEHTYTAHHYGHMEVSACAMGNDSSQDCFDDAANRLTFVSDELYGMPKDDNYPERGYLKRRGIGDPYKMYFKLPDGVSGDQVLLQYHYITANSCLPPGYREYFNWAVGNGLAETADWKGTSMADCVLPYSQE